MFDFTDTAEMDARDFYALVRPKDTGGTAPCAVLADDQGIPNRYKWPRDGEDPNAFLARVTKGARGSYYTPATFTPGTDKNGQPVRKRGGKFVHAAKALWVDIEGSEAKGGYEGRAAVLAGLERFTETTGLIPTATVLTGSGGLHAYYVTEHALPPPSWQTYAKALVALAELHGLKIDTPVTTDQSRIMRAPGSVHRKTGATALAYRTGGVYTLAELGERLGLTPGGNLPAYLNRPSRGINAELDLEDHRPRKHTPFSMLETAKHCAAVRMAMAGRGACTPYQPWILALQTAVLSVEGEDLGHEISRGHDDYDPAIVDRKMASFTGGPPSCETWHHAWGAKSPCPSCLYGEIGQ